MVRIPLEQVKRRLTLLWFSGAFLLFVIVFGQWLSDRYEDKIEEVWAWLISSLVPTLSLIIGILVADGLKNRPSRRTVDRFLFNLTAALSATYLGAALLTLLLQPLVSWTPLQMIKTSTFWLVPLQGLVTASLGAFFFKKEG